MTMITRKELVEVLQKHVCEVVFEKLNGEMRKMVCTLRAEDLPPPTKEDPLTTKKVRKINEEVLPSWDVNKNGFRSFRMDKVKSVTSTDGSFNWQDPKWEYVDVQVPPPMEFIEEGKPK